MHKYYIKYISQDMIEDVVFDANIYKFCEFVKIFEVFQSGYACETTIERVLKKCAEYEKLKYNREETCFEKNRKEYEKYINNHLIETKKLKNDFDFSFIFINLTDVESKDLNGFTLISKVQKDITRTVVQTSRLNKSMNVIGNFFILDEKNNFLDQEIAGEVQLFVAYPFLFDLIIDLDKVNSRKDTCPKF